MGKVFVARRIPDVGIKMLKDAGHRVSVWPDPHPISRSTLLKSVKGCDAILPLLTEHIDEEVLAAAGPNLKIVANYTVGYDNLDLKAFKRRGVLATNTAGTSNVTVAEHAFALALACAKRLHEADAFMRSGKYRGWKPELLLGMELSGKTIGVIGLGAIGSAVAKRAVCMEMRVLYHDVRRNEAFEKEFGAVFAETDDVLKQADIVTLHVPLMPSTRHLIDAKRLRLMKKSAILINTSRGPVVDEKALVAALKAKTISAAGIDVYEFEPKMAPGLAKLKNVILTPHTASASIEARERMAATSAQCIIDALAGKTPKNLVQ